jgi:hypothetical protein
MRIESHPVFRSGYQMRPALRAAILALAVLAAAGGVRAEQPPTDTTAPYTVAARVNLRVVYPRFLFFRVGSAGATINQLTFTALGGAVGTGAPVIASGGTALGGAALDVEVRANNGQVTITPNNSSGGLGLGTGVPADGRIGYDQIATLSDSAQLPAPVLSNAGGTPSQPALNSALVTQRLATWSYSYLNATVPSAGVYGGAAPALGGQVTYTATMP